MVSVVVLICYWKLDAGFRTEATDADSFFTLICSAKERLSFTSIAGILISLQLIENRYICLG